MSFAPGERLGRFVIESELGAGGMGQVFRARDTRLQRPVAIKVLSSEIGDAMARRRFEREALAASALNHPNIVTVLAYMSPEQAAGQPVGVRSDISPRWS